MMRGLPWRRILVAAAVLAVLVVVVLTVPSPDVEAVRGAVAGTGVWAPLTWLLLMVACTQLPFPRTVWTISAGALFGGMLGSVLALVGLGVSALLSLTVIRRLGARAVRATSDPAQHSRLAVVQEMLAERGWLSVLGLRMIPAVPFSLLNYSCAVTRIPVGPYLGATLAGSAPNTVATVVVTDTVLGGGSPWVLAVSAVVILTGCVLTAREVRTVSARVKDTA
ncbi:MULTISPECIES: TVP38/TMEM64 family protein [Corynebacterium]|nr:MULTISPECIES: VTT domain-containing protein [Corynebacterium]